MLTLSETEVSEIIQHPSSFIICNSFECREMLDSLSFNVATIIVTYHRFKKESVLIQLPSEVNHFKKGKVLKQIIAVSWLAIDEILKVRACPFCKREVYTRNNPVVICPSCKGRFS